MSLAVAALLAVSMSLSVTACATLSQLGQPNPQDRASEIEPTLSAAGFKMLSADMSQKLDQLKKMPQLTLKYYPGHEGKLHYWMADAQFCQCLYIGDDKTYQKYKEFRFQQQLAKEERESAEEQMEAAQQAQMEEQMELMNPYGFGLGGGWMFP